MMSHVYFDPHASFAEMIQELVEDHPGNCLKDTDGTISKKEPSLFYVRHKKTTQNKIHGL